MIKILSNFLKEEGLKKKHICYQIITEFENKKIYKINRRFKDFEFLYKYFIDNDKYKVEIY